MSLNLASDFFAPKSKKQNNLVQFKKKTSKNAFESSLEMIYSQKNTAELEKIFAEKLEVFHAQKSFWSDLYRTKELELLRILRKVLKTREVYVEIYS